MFHALLASDLWRSISESSGGSFKRPPVDNKTKEVKRSMRIEIRAAIFIVINGDEMQTKKEPKGRQTNLATFGGKRPSKASKPSKGAKVAKNPPKAANGLKSARKQRSDKGGWHHCSVCGAAGRKVSKKRGGYCKECAPKSGWL